MRRLAALASAALMILSLLLATAGPASAVANFVRRVTGTTGGNTTGVHIRLELDLANNEYAKLTLVGRDNGIVPGGHTSGFMRWTCDGNIVAAQAFDLTSGARLVVANSSSGVGQTPTNFASNGQHCLFIIGVDSGDLTTDTLFADVYNVTATATATPTPPATPCTTLAPMPSGQIGPPAPQPCATATPTPAPGYGGVCTSGVQLTWPAESDVYKDIWCGWLRQDLLTTAGYTISGGSMYDSPGIKLTCRRQDLSAAAVSSSEGGAIKPEGTHTHSGINYVMSVPGGGAQFTTITRSSSNAGNVPSTSWAYCAFQYRGRGASSGFTISAVTVVQTSPGSTPTPAPTATPNGDPCYVIGGGAIVCYPASGTPYPVGTPQTTPPQVIVYNPDQGDGCGIICGIAGGITQALAWAIIPEDLAGKLAEIADDFAAHAVFADVALVGGAIAASVGGAAISADNPEECMTIPWPPGHSEEVCFDYNDVTGPADFIRPIVMGIVSISIFLAALRRIEAFFGMGSAAAETIADASSR